MGIYYYIRMCISRMCLCVRRRAFTQALWARSWVIVVDQYRWEGGEGRGVYVLSVYLLSVVPVEYIRIDNVSKIVETDKYDDRML